MDVRISEPIDGTRWVYCGEGEHAMAVRVTQTGCIIPSLNYLWPGDIPNLIAALQAASEIAYKPTYSCDHRQGVYSQPIHLRDKPIDGALFAAESAAPDL